MMRQNLKRLLVGLMLLLPLPALAAPPVQEIRVRDLTGWLVSDDSLPILNIRMAWRGGTIHDPADKAGLTMLMMRLMNEGAGALPAQAYQTAMADIAMSFGFSADHDSVTASLTCLKKHQARCLELVRLALTQPRFDADAIARMKDEQRAAMLREQQSPGVIAGKALRDLAYAGHPYAAPVHGTEASLAALTADDIRSQHRRLMARDNLQLAIVGDVTRAEARRLMRDMFAGLPAENALPQVAEAIAADGPQSRHVDRAGPQTTLVFGHQGIGHDHELFFPAFVMNNILGGSGLSSRLTEEVREARGLAYSVYSGFAGYDYGALWRGSVASDNARAQEALDVIRAEMRRMAADGVSDDRLAAAKTYLTGAYALRFDSGSKIAGQLIGVMQMGLPVTYFATRNASIKAVTQADIKRAAQLLAADRLLVVSVGGTAVSLAR